MEAAWGKLKGEAKKQLDGEILGPLRERSLHSPPPLWWPPWILTTRLLFQAHLSQPQEVVLSSPG